MLVVGVGGASSGVRENSGVVKVIPKQMPFEAGVGMTHASKVTREVLEVVGNDQRVSKRWWAVLDVGKGGERCMSRPDWRHVIVGERKWRLQ